jgi:predicted transcriptional regulator of viral defense system
MDQTTAIQRLNKYDKQGRYVFSNQDLAKIFFEDSPTALKAGLHRLIKSGVLIRAIRGIYVYSLAQSKDRYLLEHIAKTLKRGEYSYISLESALSAYGSISQIPIDRLTLMTTGRKGEYQTPYGIIEFTHTKRAISDIIKNIQSTDRPLRMATKDTALRDLKRVGRNLHLVDESALYET